MSEKRNVFLSVIMPVLNGERFIVKNVKETLKVLQKIFPSRKIEIVVVDDGSTDKTLILLKRHFSQSKNIIITRNIGNIGKGWALKVGFKNSSGRYIAFLDSDLELPPMLLKTMFEIMERDNSDVVIGSKLHPESKINYPLLRKIMSVTYYRFVKLLFNLPLMDTQTGIKLFKREVLEKVFPVIMVKRFAFDLELLAVANRFGFKISQAPIELNFSKGSSLVKPLTIYQMITDTLAVFYRLKIIKYYDREFPPPKPITIALITNRFDIRFKKSDLIKIKKFHLPIGQNPVDWLVKNKNRIKEQVIIIGNTDTIEKESIEHLSGLISREDVGTVMGVRIPDRSSEYTAVWCSISYALNDVIRNVPKSSTSTIKFIPPFSLIAFKKELTSNLKEGDLLEKFLIKECSKRNLKAIYSPDFISYFYHITSLKSLLAKALKEGENYYRRFKLRSVLFFSSLVLSILLPLTHPNGWIFPSIWLFSMIAIKTIGTLSFRGIFSGLLVFLSQIAFTAGNLKGILNAVFRR